MFKNILILFFFILRIIVIYSIVKLLYRSYHDLSEIDVKEFAWWSLLLIFDIWMNTITTPIRDLGNGEK